MKRLKMFLLLLLAASLTCSLFAGCGKQADGEKLKVVTVWTGDTHSKAVYEKLVGEWNETVGKSKGIKINYEVKAGDTLVQNIQLSLEGGSAPEMFSGDGIKEFSQKGYLLSINELPSGQAAIEKYRKFAIKNRHYIGDTFYLLPVFATTQGMVYNKDMFRAAGIVDEKGEPTPPETLAELREYAKRLTNPAKQEYGLILPLKWGGFWGSDFTSPSVSSFGYEDFNPVEGKNDLAHYEPIINTYLGMKADGSIFPGAEGLDNDPARAQFAKGNIGMKMAYSFDVGVLNDQFPAQCDWGVAPYPVLDKDVRFASRMDLSSTFRMSKSSLETVGVEVMDEVFKFFISDDFVRNNYIEGVNLPADWNLVKELEIEGAKKGWVEFAALAGDSMPPVSRPTVSTTVTSGIPTLQAYFLSDIWSGKGSRSVGDTLEWYANLYNEGNSIYFEENPDLSPDDYIDKDWFLKVRIK